MSAMARRQRFRSILGNRACIAPASVFDPISARIAEDMGFDALILAGSIASMAVLGAPDLVLLTMSELSEQVRRICRASDCPLLVDADHGYGNALNVVRAVEELETAGVAALTIEDTDLPNPFGADKPRLLPIEEGLGKMRAALAGRSDPNLVVVGRTSAPNLSSIEDAVARTRAYAAAGVDAMFLSGIKTRAALCEIAQATSIPLILGGSGDESVGDVYELAALGVRMHLQGHQPFAASVKALFEALRATKTGDAPMPAIASPELLARVTRADRYKAWREDFLFAPSPSNKGQE